MKSILLKLSTAGLILFFMNIDSVSSGCEQPSIPPHIPAADCLQIWCGMSYSGCGAGNGNVCNTAKYCKS